MKARDAASCPSTAPPAATRMAQVDSANPALPAQSPPAKAPRLPYSQELALRRRFGGPFPKPSMILMRGSPTATPDDPSETLRSLSEPILPDEPFTVIEQIVRE